MPRARRRRRGRSSLIARLSLSDLTKELDRRRGMMGDLVAQRDGLMSEMALIDLQITELQALDGMRGVVAAPARGRGRPKGSGKGRGSNANSLASVLQSLLHNKTMNVADMAKAASETGYRSTSKNFQKVVGLTLLKNKNLYKRVSRGMYTAK